MTSTAYDDSQPGRASEWFLAVHACPDDRELLARHAAWLAEDETHVVDWQEICQTYELLGLTVPQSIGQWADFANQRKGGQTMGAGGQASSVHDSRIKRSHRSHRRRWPVSRKVIMTGAVAASLAWLVAPMAMVRLQADFLSGTAAPRSVTLADGSTVRLAPESAIAVDYDAGQRGITLLKGEAFFEVRHDPTRPFRVRANDIHTTVLGTAFDVAMNGKGAAVAVKRGRVRVDNVAPDTAFSRTLSPGHSLRADWNGHITEDRSPPDLVAGWTQGHIVARDMRVADMVDAMRPWFSGAIILRGERLGRQPLTGIYRLDRPVEALQAVAETQGATLRQITPWIIVMSEN